MSKPTIKASKSTSNAAAVNNSAAIVTGRVIGSLFRLSTQYTVVAAKATAQAARDVAHGVREGHRGETF